MSGTPLTNEIPGWYINFQVAVLKQLPRPDQLEQRVAEAWVDSQQMLKVALLQSLILSIPGAKTATSNLIVRKVKVNRHRYQQEAIEATGRKQYTDRKVVDAMPKGEGDEVEVVFFKPDLSQRNGLITDDDLEKEFELRGLKPADPVSVAAVNEADPAFADEKPNGTHWKDADGKWCYIAFDRWCGGERGVHVYRGSRWAAHWWFAGFRK